LNEKSNTGSALWEAIGDDADETLDSQAFFQYETRNKAHHRNASLWGMIDKRLQKGCR
jgi:hypothetical protein